MPIFGFVHVQQLRTFFVHFLHAQTLNLSFSTKPPRPDQVARLDQVRKQSLRKEKIEAWIWDLRKKISRDMGASRERNGIKDTMNEMAVRLHALESESRVQKAVHPRADGGRFGGEG